MKRCFALTLLAVSSAAFSETVFVHDLYGCPNLQDQRDKLAFIAALSSCRANGCKREVEEESQRNYSYIQTKLCRPVPDGNYSVLKIASRPGGRIVQVKSKGELLWVLD